MSTTGKRRLAIIGCGSSGLACLKQALDRLPDWEIVCFEKSSSVVGCWGNPYPGFTSTSTKYTTQFSTFPIYDANCDLARGDEAAEFFRGNEYGNYLNQYADRFGLRESIRFRQTIVRISRPDSNGGWLIDSVDEEKSPPQPISQERFDAVCVCTGLVACPKNIDTDVPAIDPDRLRGPSEIDDIRQQQIVVMGGGESAVDDAVRLSRPDLGNKVFLSLRGGIRVSPRYHPIRNVPSDFLRNRLMLSIAPELRNWIGERFVRFRIDHQQRMERWFPSKIEKKLDHHDSVLTELADDRSRCEREWAAKLTRSAKDDLFNMFHNKSDDFLRHVADGRITIVGPPTDRAITHCKNFHGDDDGVTQTDATLVVPSIGYQSRVAELFDGQIKLSDFHLGFCHVTHPDLFLIGFARPIIGNIPTISEMQSRVAVELIARRIERPENIDERNRVDRRCLKKRFSKLDLDAIYPVEMFPYCDRLARWLNVYPTLRRCGSVRRWLRIQLSPATTLHYWPEDPEAKNLTMNAPIYLPAVLILLLLLLKPIDWVFRILGRFRK